MEDLIMLPEEELEDFEVEHERMKEKFRVVFTRLNDEEISRYAFNWLCSQKREKRKCDTLKATLEAKRVEREGNGKLNPSPS